MDNAVHRLIEFLINTNILVDELYTFPYADADDDDDEEDDDDDSVLSPCP